MAATTAMIVMLAMVAGALHTSTYSGTLIRVVQVATGATPPVGGLVTTIFAGGIATITWTGSTISGASVANKRLCHHD